MERRTRIYITILTIVFLINHEATAEVTFTPSLRDQMNRLGINIFAKLADQKNNVLLSPICITEILNVLYTGSQGQTAEEIAKVLDYEKTNLTRPEIEEAFKHALAAQKQHSQQFTSIYNNFLGITNTVKVLPDFTRHVTEYFSTEARQLDFTKSSTTSDINKWISEQTKGNIPNALKSNLSPSTQLFLACGDYFSGKWASSFDPKLTKQEPFFSYGGNTTKNVSMMYMQKILPYAYDIDTNSEFVEIPFDGEDLTMVIMLPKTADGILDVEKSFTAENVNLAMGEMNPIKIYLRIPKIKMTAFYDLNEAMQKMGIVQAFVSEKADFSKIDGAKDLVVSQVVEAGAFEISEEGTSPPPDSSEKPELANAGYDLPKVEYFTADHPFGFLIRHKPSGVILYIGRIMSP